MNTKGSNASKRVGKQGELPQTPDQWSQFEVSDDLLTAWSHETMKKTGINAHTIAEPYLLFHTLDSLDKMLSDIGLDHLRFPVVHLQLILLNTCLKFDQPASSGSLNTYVRLKLINLCIELNLINSVSFHQQALANVITGALKIQATDSANPSPLSKETFFFCF